MQTRLRSLLSVSIRRNAVYIAAFHSLMLATSHGQSTTTLLPTERDLVAEVLQNEISHSRDTNHVAYTSLATSKRTNGHLWEEHVVEFDGGIMRRLIAIDGRPLSARKTQEEDARIADLVAHPDKLRDQSKTSKDDGQAQGLAKAMLSAFRFSYDGEHQGCVRIRFTPDSTFRAQDFEQRILQALKGEFLVHPSDHRFCSVNARLPNNLRLGFGVLANIQRGGSVFFARTRLRNGEWVLLDMDVNITGRMLLVKSLVEEDTESHRGIHSIPKDTNVSQAAMFLQP